MNNKELKNGFKGAVMLSLPTVEEIEIKFPCETGQIVTMESGKTYWETLQTNYHRRQGAMWLLDELKKGNGA